VLTNLEKEYCLSATELTTDEHIAQLYQHIEAQTCEWLDCPPPRGDTVPVRLRALFNAAFDFSDSMDDYAKDWIHRAHFRATVGFILADLWRVQNFMAVRDEVPETYERFAELLFRLEKEVFGKPKTLPKRIAYVRIGEPLELSEYAAAYHHSRKAALATVTAEIEERLNTLLTDALQSETRIQRESL
jgi:hypothetical protein